MAECRNSDPLRHRLSPSIFLLFAVVVITTSPHFDKKKENKIMNGHKDIQIGTKCVYQLRLISD